MQLRKFGFNLGRIHHVFISHLHGDHVFGLFGLLSSMGMMGRKATVHLYGPARLEEWLNVHLNFFGPLPFRVDFHPVSGTGEAVLQDGKLTVTPIRLEHRVPAYGYLFREERKALNIDKQKIALHQIGIADMARIKQGGDHVTPQGKVIPNRELTMPPFRQRSYAYVSDTRYDPTLAAQLSGVDVLFHEATFSGKDSRLAEETMHSTTVQAATLARDAGAGRLLIGHFSSRYRDVELLEREAREVFPRTDAVYDGFTCSVPLERQSKE